MAAEQDLMEALADEIRLNSEIDAHSAMLRQERDFIEQQPSPHGASALRATWLVRASAGLIRKRTERTEAESATVLARSRLTQAMTNEALISALSEAERARIALADQRRAQAAFAEAIQARFTRGRRQK